ncbi:NAD-dependent epimerase/dehydratase family protein [Synechococcus sp. CS-602]|uniref:NAD-dependent epimerase/dehydratase family protein n=1 Tax=Synechococcaceae TaxID=1890426 RepID=UPI0008FF11E6|nr:MULTISPECIES: NAD-dependent epimerase/dehydratase family protein [Synechococcaceae]MCT4364618.1 NAD-dependent epimerase/dehydratase family protein [Candidatus Regnicoccus frigidus MAG-AL1]APD47794.1 oxidoreductase [Synechococcus sp. SynAce01]MCT0202867.1 NAD-dependent epimerase/dehydratase family protein [Synechococcus sp. CS-603]MCT0204857.1 NAD-dependent epimerase/dehydratase family protein [Synechococcus sp. CS-602]MCT0245093.1 NAD-dependent epimerase/dehydratase family protein [Synechoc
MRITIVGCGYVGTALARHWHQQGRHWLRVTTTSADRAEELAAVADSVQVLDAADPIGLRQALQGSEAAVFCLAPSGERQVDADGYEATFLRSMQALAAVVGELPQLNQLLYTSSCSVYGNAGGLLEEDTPLQPRDRHGEILRDAEAVLLSCRSPSRRVAIWRLGALYGPGRELQERFRSLAGSQRQGNGAALTSWIHRDDVVAALALALETGLDGVFNLVDDAPISVRDLIDLTCRAAGLKPVIWEAEAAPAADAGAGRRVSNRRLHGLGFQLQHPRLPVLAGRPLAPPR